MWIRKSLCQGRNRAFPCASAEADECDVVKSSQRLPPVFPVAFVTHFIASMKVCPSALSTFPGPISSLNSLRTKGVVHVGFCANAGIVSRKRAKGSKRATIVGYSLFSMKQ
jgi:hypothetical protein